jgi:capsular exopolysaccharide synthesis family protein
MMIRDPQQQQQLALQQAQLQQMMMPYLQMQMALQRPIAPEAPASGEPSILRSIWRNLWIVVLMLALSIGGAVVFLKNTTPLYTSTAQIYIDLPTNPAVATAGQERSGYLFTVCQIIRSDSILREVAERDDIKKLATFEQIAPLTYMRKHLSAEVGRRDDIIYVAIPSTHAEDAAVIVNEIVATFIRYHSSERFAGVLAQLEAVSKTRDEMQKKLESIQAAIRELKTREPDLAFNIDGNNNPAMIELEIISSQLAEAKLQTLVLRNHAGARSPQLADAISKEETLDSAYREVYAKIAKLAGRSQELDKLQADEMFARQMLEQIKPRVRDLQLAVDQRKLIGAGDAKTVDQARVETDPSYPRKAQTLALAAAAGLILGIGLAILRDKMDTRLRSPDEIQTAVNLPILGVVPRMPGRRSAVARAMAVHLDSRSEVAESYRTIRTAVYFGNHGGKIKTLLVTSAEPGDGKTTSASNLAIAIAQTGRSILLLDADFRKPTQHKNLDVKDNIGLSSVLAGVTTLDRAIQRTGVDGLDILPCGPVPENPSEILNSQEFGELIDKLALKYDHILFDSPPVNRVTDARILAAVCDATILVVRSDKTTRRAAEHARNALLSVGANVLGVVINGVPRGKGYEVYGGGYYGSSDVRGPTAVVHGVYPAEEPEPEIMNGNGHSNGAKPSVTRMPRSSVEMDQ